MHFHSFTHKQEAKCVSAILALFLLLLDFSFPQELCTGGHETDSASSEECASRALKVRFPHRKKFWILICLFLTIVLKCWKYALVSSTSRMTLCFWKTQIWIPHYVLCNRSKTKYAMLVLSRGLTRLLFFNSSIRVVWVRSGSLTLESLHENVQQMYHKVLEMLWYVPPWPPMPRGTHWH
jgi:hypothetical protein